MLKYLRRLAEHTEWGWVAAVIMAVLQAIYWLDRWLFNRYRKRVSDALEWNEALDEKLEEARNVAFEAKAELGKAEDRIDDLEDRAKTAEEHAEWCEEKLLHVAGRLEEDSDVEWDVQDVEVPESAPTSETPTPDNTMSEDDVWYLNMDWQVYALIAATPVICALLAGTTSWAIGTSLVWGALVGGLVGAGLVASAACLLMGVLMALEGGQ